MVSSLEFHQENLGKTAGYPVGFEAGISPSREVKSPLQWRGWGRSGEAGEPRAVLGRPEQKGGRSSSGRLTAALTHAQKMVFAGRRK